MSETVAILLLFFGVPAAISLAMLLGACLEWASWQVGNVFGGFQARLGSWRATANEKSRRKEDRHSFLRWLASKTGTDPLGSAVDEQLVLAQQQTEPIRALVEEEVPQAVMRCVETHRLLAKVTGATHMVEIAYEPECHHLRAHVVWLLAHTVQFLEEYPLRLNDARLLHNSIILRKRALPICRRCPYIQLPVDQAPRLCPTAELISLRGGQNEPIR